MNRSNPQTRVILSIVGIVLISISMILNFTGNAGVVSWGLLGGALLVLLISGRYR